MRSDRVGPSLLAWSAFALTAAMAVSTVVIGAIDNGTRVTEDGGRTVSALGAVSFALMMVSLGVTGALIASRRPSNPIGWILCASPLFLGLTALADDWYVHALYASDSSASVPEALVWAANWAWIPGFVPLLTLLLLLFPDGRPPSPRWRPAGWVAVAAMASLVLGYAFAPGRLEDYPRVDNPLGAGGLAGDVSTVLLNAGFPLFSVAALLATASLVVRYRRSRSIERQQLKWMAAAAAIVVLSWLVRGTLDWGFGIDISAILPLALLGLPAAAAVAVLRYRLYDLNLVVNRALVYGGLSVALAGTYIGSVLLLQLVLGSLTPDSDLAIAGSTLAAAALFRPARRRIQATVDRRFYRRRFDAARTVEAFSTRLRDEVELDAVEGELRAITAATMQPAYVSLWLSRPEETRP